MSMDADRGSLRKKSGSGITTGLRLRLTTGFYAFAVAARYPARSSSTSSRAAFLAASFWLGANEIAPTRAWPPPPYRSHNTARFVIFAGGILVHGFEPTDTLVLKLLLLRPML